MQTEEFLQCVYRGEVPPEPPDGCTESGWGHGGMEPGFGDREECCRRGMWAIVTKQLGEQLSAWIGPRKVLEIMAGPGWLAKALTEAGVEIVPTDNGSWNAKHSKAPFLLPVVQMDCIDAIRVYADAEVLLVSWPPYGDEAICRACEEWGTDRPIVYLGEGPEGCNAPDEFWKYFREIDRPGIRLLSWPGLHDHVYVGYYRYDPSKEDTPTDVLRRNNDRTERTLSYLQPRYQVQLPSRRGCPGDWQAAAVRRALQEGIWL